jgi:choline-sulfatase
MKPSNLLFLLSDQHARRFTGCYGHPIVQTPNIDALARSGTTFRNAYTPAPICVPARASLATGRHVYDHACWDNARPYTGAQPSWGHRLQANGHAVLSIGKLHYRNDTDDVGLDEQRHPMHVIDGEGMLFTILRDPVPVQKKFRMMVQGAGPGESSYTRYDADITREAVAWLRKEAPHQDRPWVLFVSLVCPHPPFVAPPEFFHRYDPASLPMPMAYSLEERPHHPVLEELRRFFGVDEPIDAAIMQRVQAAYFGMITYLDENIGQILSALADSGQAANTRILYTSDHGESMGQKGMFSKCNFYDESVGIPMIIAGPEVPVGRVVDTPTSLVDCFPTVLDAVGVPLTAEDADLPGRSLFDLAAGVRPARYILSEHHSVGFRHSGFMVRWDSFKYVYYVNAAPQLFDLATDPEELTNLAQDPDYAAVLSRGHEALCGMLDPGSIDAVVKADQSRRIHAAGGVQAILDKGSTGYTPAPGEIPVFVR